MAHKPLTGLGCRHASKRLHAASKSGAFKSPQTPSKRPKRFPFHFLALRIGGARLLLNKLRAVHRTGIPA